MLALTGATGYIGTALLRELQGRGVAVTTIGRRPVQPDIPHRPLDLSAKQGFRAALDGAETVIHCAGIAHHKGSQDALERINVLATLALADAALSAGCRRFVFLSSLNVVPAGASSAALPVSRLPRPGDPYSASKWRAEQQLQAILSGSQCELIVVRPALVYDAQLVASLAQLAALLARWPLALPAIGARSMVSRPDLTKLLADYALDASAGSGVLWLPVTDGQCYDLARIGRGLLGNRRPWIPVPGPALHLAARLRDRTAGLPPGSTWQGLAGKKWCSDQPSPMGFAPRTTFAGALFGGAP